MISISHEGTVVPFPLTATVKDVLAGLGGDVTLTHTLLVPSMNSSVGHSPFRYPTALALDDVRSFRKWRQALPYEPLGSILRVLHRQPSLLYTCPITLEVLILGARGSQEGTGTMGYFGAGDAQGGGGIFSLPALIRLATLENTARLSPEFQVLFNASEGGLPPALLGAMPSQLTELGEKSYLLSRFDIPDWMTLCTELQHDLVTRALLHLATTTPSDTDLGGFDATPALLSSSLLHSLGYTRDEGLSRALNGAFTRGVSQGGQPAFLQRVLQGVHQLRTAGGKHKEIWEISLYWKYNRARPGTLRDGDAAPDAPLVTLPTSSSAADPPSSLITSLHALIRASHPKPLCLLAGSYS